MLLLQTSFHESCIFGNRGNDRTSVLTTNTVLTTFEKIQKLNTINAKTNTAIQSVLILWFLPEIRKKSKVGFVGLANIFAKIDKL